MTIWWPFEAVAKVVVAAQRGEWSWCNNSKCKYIELRIDMRFGRCTILDRDKIPLTLDELEFQLNNVEEGK